MYNDELKKALEETYRERMDAFPGADEQHEFSPAFEKKMKKLIRSAERGKITDAEEFIEKEPVKLKFSAAKWIAVAASFCLLAAGGVLLVNMLYDNNILNPWTDSSYESSIDNSSNSSTESVVRQIPAFIEYNGLELPTAGAYKKEGNMDFCYYDFAIVKRYDPSRLYYHTTDGVQTIPTDVNDADSKIGECIKLHVGDEVGGLTVSKASSRYSIKFDENGEAYFLPKELGYNSFTMEGEITLSGILEYNGTDSILCVDPANFGELLPYIPAEFEDSGSSHVPTDVDADFNFSADSGYMFIHVDGNVFADEYVRFGGLYEVGLSARSITIGYNESGGLSGASADISSVDWFDVKADVPMTVTYCNMSLPIEGGDVGSYYPYDYAILRKLDKSELLYKASETADDVLPTPENISGSKDYLTLKSGDMIGGLTVIEGSMQMKLDTRTKLSGGIEYYFTDEQIYYALYGEITLKGIMEYDPLSSYVQLCVDPSGFDELLPYVPAPYYYRTYTLSTPADGKYDYYAASCFPIVELRGEYGFMEAAGFEKAGLYEVEVTVGQLDYAYGTNYKAWVSAPVTSFDSVRLKAEPKNGLPEKATFMGYELPTDTEISNSKFIYDYAIVREVTDNELYYNEYDPDSNGGNDTVFPGNTGENYEMTTLKVGDKVGDMTVTEAGAGLYLSTGSNPSFNMKGGYNKFTLEGSMTLTGLLGYDRGYDCYVMCVDPKGFKQSLPYIPLGLSDSFGGYELKPENSGVWAKSGYSLVYINADSIPDFDSLSKEDTRKATITVDMLDFNNNENSSYSGIFAHATSLKLS